MSMNTSVKSTAGCSDPNVSLMNGKLAFSISIGTLKTPGGAETEIKLQYQSGALKQEFETWAAEVNEGIVAAGWNLSCNSKIMKLSNDKYRYWMSFGGVIYELTYEKAEGDFEYYRTITPSNLIPRHRISDGCWIVMGIDANLYYFGRNDAFTNERGQYVPQTGTYTQASAEYEQVRHLIVKDGTNGLPENRAVANTICSTGEIAVSWNDGWIGPSYNVIQQQSFACGWNLSHIEDPFGNVISFSYIQHISDVCSLPNSKTYTVGSYLYRVRLTLQGEQSECEKYSFTYADKDTSEYSIDWTMLERPNGMQQRFEILRLSSITHYIATHARDMAVLETQLLVSDTGLNKRLLQAVRFVDVQNHGIEYMPGYVMTYYAQDDGVHVSNAGFDDEHPYFNQNTGALYGNLKELTYPSGEKRVYRYAENDLSSIGLTYFEELPASDGLEFIHTPYNYSIAVQTIASDNTMKIFAYTWTSGGWHKQLLVHAAAPSPKLFTFRKERHISYSSHMIGVIYENTWTTYPAFSVFTRDAGGEGMWNASPFDNVLGWNTLFGPEGKFHLAVGETGVAFTTLLTTQEYTEPGYLWFFSTPDNGHTFQQVRYQSLAPLSDGASSYHATLSITERACVIMMLKDEQDNVVPSDFHPSSWQPQHAQMAHVSAAVGVSSLDSDQLRITMLAKIPIIINRFKWDASVWYKGIAYIGGKIVTALDVHRNGNFFTLRVLSRMQSTSFRYSDHEITTSDSEPMSWDINFLADATLQQFRFYCDAANIEERDLDIAAGEFVMLTRQLSAHTSRNGAIYSYYYWYNSEAPSYEAYNTIYLTYDGNNIHRQTQPDKKYLGCIMKDDVFVSFEEMIDHTTSRRTYRYLNHKQMIWQDLSTGAISRSTTSYNKGAQVALEVLEYLGLALFAILAPFSLSSVAGILFTVLSVSFMAAGYTAQAVLKNSVHTSLNPSCSYYGNRFINDGTTIWFREHSQDRLTAIGSGESYQPYDSLSGSGVFGTILADKQQYGIVYSYIPFITSESRIYYRRMKNNSVAGACALGGVAGGVNDLYLYQNVYYAFAGPYRYSYDVKTKKLIDTDIIADVLSHFNRVDGCFTLRFSSNSSNDKLFLFSGDEMSIKHGNVQTPPAKICDVISGCEFYKVDCAMESGNWERPFFYLFCDGDFEKVEIDDYGMRVTQRGTIKQIFPTLPFDKIDAGFVLANQSYYFFRGNRYAELRQSDGVVLQRGIVGSDLMWDDFEQSEKTMSFTESALSVRYGNCVQLHKFVGNRLDGTIKDYVVKTADHYTDPRIEGPVSSLTYAYDIRNASFLEAAQSAVYVRTLTTIDD